MNELTELTGGLDQRNFASIEYVEGQMYLVMSELNEDAEDDEKEYEVSIGTTTQTGYVAIKYGNFTLERADEIVATKAASMAENYHKQFTGE